MAESNYIRLESRCHNPATVNVMKGLMRYIHLNPCIPYLELMWNNVKWEIVVPVLSSLFSVVQWNKLDLCPDCLPLFTKMNFQY